MSDSRDEGCEIVRTSRQIIENKLLIALDDSGCVAILATDEDLKIIIDGLTALGPSHTKAREMSEDFRLLHRSAFKP